MLEFLLQASPVPLTFVQAHMSFGLVNQTVANLSAQVLFRFLSWSVFPSLTCCGVDDYVVGTAFDSDFSSANSLVHPFLFSSSAGAIAEWVVL